MSLVKTFKVGLLSAAFFSVLVLSISWANEGVTHSPLKAQTTTLSR